MNMKTRFIAIVACMGVLVAQTSASAPILTGAAQFSTDSSGNFAGGNIWNSFGGDSPFNLYLTEANSGINGSLQNTGNSNPTTQLNTVLDPGSHTFFMFGEPGVEVGFYGLNLFFNSDNTNPEISVFAPTSLSSPPPFPSFSANSSLSTPDVQFSTFIPGSGELGFYDGLFSVSITDYVFSVPSVHNLNRVQRYGSTPGGDADFVGQFTLTVSPLNAVPEPNLLTLLGIGFVGLLYGRQWKRKPRVRVVGLGLE